MPKKIDMTGVRFGRLMAYKELVASKQTVLQRLTSRISNHTTDSLNAFVGF